MVDGLNDSDELELLSLQRQRSMSQGSQEPWYSSAADAINSAKEGVINAIPGLSPALKTLGSRPELVPYGMGNSTNPLPPVSSAIDAARQTLSAPLRMGSTLMAAPEMGGEAISNIGNQAGYPKTGAAIGTAVSMIPQIAAAGEGLSALYDSQNPYIKGMINKPKEFSPDFAFQNEKAGIIKGNLPVRRGTQPIFNTTTPEGDTAPLGVPSSQVPYLQPKYYPSNDNALLNMVDARLKLGSLDPNELTNYKEIIGTILDKGVKKIGKDAYSQAADLKGQVATAQAKAITDSLQGVDVPNGMMQTREGLNKAYGVAKVMHPEIAKFIAAAGSKFGPWAVRGILAHLGWDTLN